jgi:hypothetical protein
MTPNRRPLGQPPLPPTPHGGRAGSGGESNCLAGFAGLVIGISMMIAGYSVGRGSAQPYPAPVLVSAACPSASLPPSLASVEAPMGRPDMHAARCAPGAPCGPDESPQAAPGGASRRSKDEELVRSAVGRWRGDDGMTVEIDPPKPLPGKAPPFRLVVRGKGLPKSGFGCEFAGGDERRGPGEIVYFKAWCARGKRATVGLEISYPEGAPASLSVVILQDGELRVRAHGQRIDPTGDAP